MPWTSPTGNVYDSGSYHAALARLLQAADYEALRAEQARRRAEGRHIGIGLACFIELTGPGAQFYGVGGAPISGQDGTTLRMEPSGAVTALVGVTNQGQGTPTALAQIIGDELALPVDAITVLSGDTAMTPYGGGTSASRGMPIGGSATLLAARALAAKIRVVAGTLLEAHPDDVELTDGRAVIRGSARGLGYAELARTVHFRSGALKGLEPSLEATVRYTNSSRGPSPPAPTWPSSRWTSRRARTGPPIRGGGRLRAHSQPGVVEGQIAGGVAQGLGGALFEHCAYDAAGQLLTATLMDYAVPTAADLPPFELHHLETSAPSIAGGFKGAGEAGTTGAPAAILNAVNDALAPYGVLISDQPVTPERVLRALGRI